MTHRPVLMPSATWSLLAALLLQGCTVRSFIYPVPGVEVGTPPTGFEEIELPLTGGNRAVGWHHPGPESSTRPALIFFHGNGENLETLKWGGLYDHLLALDSPLLVVDYPGYGRSTGQPSEQSLKNTADEALKWMEAQYPDRPIVPCGWSLGAALAVHLGRLGPPRVQGLIAISSWTSLKAVAEIHFPTWLVGVGLRENYDSLGVADQVEVPTLVVHGTVDRIIPVDQGRQLARGVVDARWVEVGPAGHNDLLGFPEVWREIEAFVSSLSRPEAL